MPRVTVPEGQDPTMYVWTSLAKPMTQAASALSGAVYADSILSLREFEAARIAMAQINDCLLCLNWRSARDVSSRADEADSIDEAFYAHIGEADWDGYSAREALCAEFAQRYAQDHVNMDDDLWNRMHANFTDDEIVDLAICVGSWLAYGRFNRVFDIDGGCRIPQHS